MYTDYWFTHVAHWWQALIRQQVMRKEYASPPRERLMADGAIPQGWEAFLATVHLQGMVMS